MRNLSASRGIRSRNIWLAPREAVQQQQLRCIDRPRFTIEDLETVDISGAISVKRHQTLLSVGDLHHDQPASLGRSSFPWTVNPSVGAPAMSGARGWRRRT